LELSFSSLDNHGAVILVDVRVSSQLADFSDVVLSDTVDKKGGDGHEEHKDDDSRDAAGIKEVAALLLLLVNGHGGTSNNKKVNTDYVNDSLESLNQTGKSTGRVTINE